MVQTPPPPPSISPRQMNLLRIVTAMAWADGDLAAAEVEVMLDRFSSIFSQATEQQQHLRQELRDYMMQNIPIQEVVPKLQNADEKALVLRLGYEVIVCSSRTPEEAKINLHEAAAYQKLVDLLGLPPETVQQIEAEVETSGISSENLVDRLTQELQDFMH